MAYCVLPTKQQLYVPHETGELRTVLLSLHSQERKTISFTTKSTRFCRAGTFQWHHAKTQSFVGGSDAEYRGAGARAHGQCSCKRVGNFFTDQRFWV